jgi:hypothetical protein
MQRLRIGKKQAGDEDDALLEEAIKLAAVEEKEMKVKEKENCTHGYDSSSIFQARICEDYLKVFTEGYHAALDDNTIPGRLDCIAKGFSTARMKYTNELKQEYYLERLKSYSFAEGTKFILDGNYDGARVCAIVALQMKVLCAVTVPDAQKCDELSDADEHTLVQFFRKHIPCSCLEEKYKQVKSITKMGICGNGACPLPGNRAVRSKMLKCTGCHNVSYCSRECQEAAWAKHKKICGKVLGQITNDIRELLGKKKIDEQN